MPGSTRARRCLPAGCGKRRRGAAPRLSALCAVPEAMGARATAFAALAIALVAGAAVDDSPAGGQARPNVVVLMTDDQTVESLRVMPNLLSLVAERGTTFANSFASTPLCCPSRATFLSGQYRHNHGVLDNTPPDGGYQRFDNTRALPVWLQAAGYWTAHVGKYLNGYGRRRPTEVPPGWSEWHGSVDPSTYRYFDFTLNQNGTLVRYRDVYQTDLYKQRALEIIRRRAAEEQPFFLSVAFLAPHTGGPRDPDDPRGFATASPAPRHRDRFASEPLASPPSFNEADVSDKPAAIRRLRSLTGTDVARITEGYRQRLESLLAVDEGVGDVVAALAESGELDETLIVFTSDNGFFHGEHRVRSGKVLAYEPSARVPLVLRGPGVPRGVVLQQLAANVDLAPTILDATGARPGRTIDGRSLFPLLADPGRELGRAILLEAPGYRAVRTRRYVYIEHISTRERELYDLRRDPDQLQNLAGSERHAALREALAGRLVELRGCDGRECSRPPRLRVELRGARPCVRRRASARLRGADLHFVQFADFSLNGRRAGRDGRAPFVHSVPSTSAPGGLSATLRTLAVLEDGRAVTLDRRLRVCGS
jgi:arylsulfatase A-like enzyme